MVKRFKRFKKMVGVTYTAPLEHTFDRLIHPFESFIQRQTTSGIVLLLCTVIALIAANSPLSDLYQHLIHIPMSIELGEWRLEKSLQHWVNEGLMAIFFFVVGLELKQELTIGELAEPKKALLPIIAALGGMVVPALIYIWFNVSNGTLGGWGIPMATDIAFAIGVLVLLGDRIPRSLVTFLVALAIIDDLGAVIVIALFYTQDLNFDAIVLATAMTGLLVMLNLAGVRKTTPYFIIAVLLWFAFLYSGIHATIAGVIGAFTVPSKPKYDPVRFDHRIRKLLIHFERIYRPGESIMRNELLRALVQTMEKNILQVQAPLQRLERIQHLAVSLVIVPLFALFNAGISFAEVSFASILGSPVTLGVWFGLLLGKFVGITGFSWLAVKFGFGHLPSNINFYQISGVALVAGIGFTMSIFISELAFSTHPIILAEAKTGILIASVLSAIAGLSWLVVFSKKTDSLAGGSK